MDQKYEYNCLMLYYDIKNWNAIVDSMINENDIFTEEDKYGIEYDPHVTVLYGLHPEVGVEDVKSLCKPLNEYKTCIDSIGMFEPEGYDVLKFNVKCDAMVETNSALCDVFDFTSDFDSYIPHMTIGYLKTGTAKPYCKKLKNTLIIYPSKFVYSMVDGTEEEFII